MRRRHDDHRRAPGSEVSRRPLCGIHSPEVKWPRRRRGHSEEPETHDAPRSSQQTLEERLRNLDWPKPPEGVKERLLEDLMRRLEESKRGDSGGRAKGPDSGGRDPSKEPSRGPNSPDEGDTPNEPDTPDDPDG